LTVLQSLLAVGIDLNDAGSGFCVEDQFLGRLWKTKPASARMLL
jgi:hypothetical protein